MSTIELNINVHHYFHGTHGSDDKLNKILAACEELKKEIKQMGPELEALNTNLATLTTEVNDLATVEASAEAALSALVAKQNELTAKLQAAIDAGNPTDIQAAADSLAAQNVALEAAKSKLAAAIANIPA